MQSFPGQGPVLLFAPLWSPSSSSQPIPLARLDYQTRLCDSFFQASLQVQWDPIYFRGKKMVSLSGDYGPAGEGLNKAWPSSWDEFGAL